MAWIWAQGRRTALDGPVVPGLGQLQILGGLEIGQEGHAVHQFEWASRELLAIQHHHRLQILQVGGHLQHPVQEPRQGQHHRGAGQIERMGH
jgi:hypothetical protein